MNSKERYYVYWASDYLRCYVPTWFWISWRDGLIALGNGSTVGNYSFMIFEDYNPIAVNYAAVSSTSNNTVVWFVPGQFYDTC